LEISRAVTIDPCNNEHGNAWKLSDRRLTFGLCRNGGFSRLGLCDILIMQPYIERGWEGVRGADRTGKEDCVSAVGGVPKEARRPGGRRQRSADPSGAAGACVLPWGRQLGPRPADSFLIPSSPTRGKLRRAYPLAAVFPRRPRTADQRRGPARQVGRGVGRWQITCWRSPPRRRRTPVAADQPTRIRLKVEDKI